ncbi:MAG: STAS domain-containing protein [bacterium]|nr:STAS domain-containing protein [bacterium]MDE0669818.1 STAS domain-containing protein [bacterium]
MFEVQVEVAEDCTVCRPVGELDAYTVGDFREALGSVDESARLVVDLSGVPFMDSAGLGALIGGIRRVRDGGGAISVLCDRPAITRLLHTTGFDRIVPMVETMSAALEALGPVDES